ncbi:MAG: hypothetical protein H6818_19500 [Phycisphaerales bacterium]|nr:hypothetical protein [Phycisphaerales bacterium]MCB9863652.1 hypothetical protein [Phycisphaerales bacterium]
MRAKILIKGVLLTFVVVSVAYMVVTELSNESVTLPADEENVVPVVAAEMATSDVSPAPAKVQPSGQQRPSHRIIAYYFHNTQRCKTCLAIERLSEAALREEFGHEFQSGVLEWRVINMEEPPNEHFVQDYGLVTSSLVLVDTLDGEQRAWINMDRVWQLIHDDEAAFKQYVAEQARKYLES